MVAAINGFVSTLSFGGILVLSLILGVVSGTNSLIFTLTAELCTDKNQTRAFATLGFGEGIGRLLAPVIFGSLSCIILNKTFPFLLPFLFLSFLSIISLTGALTVIQNCENQPKTEISSLLEKKTARSSGYAATQDETPNCLLLENIRQKDQTESEHLKLEEDKTGDSNLEYLKLEEKKTQQNKSEYIQLEEDPKQDRSDPGVGPPENAQANTTTLGARLTAIWKALVSEIVSTGRNTRICLAMTVLRSAILGTFPQIIVLLLITDSVHGGYSFSGGDISWLYVFPSCVEIFYQFLLYPLVANKLGVKRTYQVGVFCLTAFILVFPWATRVTGPRTYSATPYRIPSHAPLERPLEANASNASLTLSPFDLNIINFVEEYSHQFTLSGSGPFNQSAPPVDYCFMPPDSNVELILDPISMETSVYLSLVICLLVLSRMTCNTSGSIMVVNSCSRRNLSMSNSLAESLRAFTYVLSNGIMTTLFAWSEKNGYSWPLNYHLAFIIYATFAASSGFLSIALTDSVNYKEELDNPQ